MVKADPSKQGPIQPAGSILDPELRGGEVLEQNQQCCTAGHGDVHAG
jgi:hypothetical protein